MPVAGPPQEGTRDQPYPQLDFWAWVTHLHIVAMTAGGIIVTSIVAFQVLSWLGTSTRLVEFPIAMQAAVLLLIAVVFYLRDHARHGIAAHTSNDALERFITAWLGVWVCLAAFYVAVLLAMQVGSRKLYDVPASARDCLNSLQGIFWALAARELSRPTTVRAYWSRLLVWSMPVVAAHASFAWYAQTRIEAPLGCSHPYVQAVQGVSGVVVGIGLALFLARFESVYLSPPPVLRALWFLYAVLQPLYFVFDDSGFSSQGAHTVIFDTIVTVLVLFGLFAKLSLALFAYWCVRHGRLLFYMTEIASLSRSVENDWFSFRQFLLQGPGEWRPNSESDASDSASLEILEADSGLTLPSPEVVRVLKINAQPCSLPPLGIPDEDRALSRALGGHQLVIVPNARPDDLIEACNDRSYDIVHLSAHGDVGGIHLINPFNSRASLVVNAEQLAAALDALTAPPDLLLLAVCDSLEIAKQLRNKSGHVVGMNGRISGQAAETYSSALYKSLARGETVIKSHERAVQALRVHHKDVALPELFVGCVDKALAPCAAAGEN